MSDENPGRRSYRNTHSVSRHTMVLRRAKEEDERRIAERDAALEAAHGETCGMDDAPEGSLFAASRSTRLTVRGGTPPQTGTSVSGRNTTRRVTIRDSSSLSGRLSSRRLTGEQAEGLRVAGGDTIIRYRSGDMVIHRGARRASLQKQSIVLYAAGYILLFGLYSVFLFTGTTTITPREFVDRSFSKRTGSGVAELEQAAYGVMRGNRTPAEIRVAQPLSFYDANANAVHIEAGNRLTLPNAAKLAQAIIADGPKPENLRTFTRPIAIYKETYLSTVNWPVVLSLYNAFGFFLLLALFLWRPLMHYLGTQAKKTAVALRNSRDAVEESAERRKKYREMEEEATNRLANLRMTTQTRLEQERAEAVGEAHRRASEISGGIRSALEAEERELAARIGGDTARRACDAALEIIRARAGKKEHDAAIDKLIADIGAMTPRESAV